MLVTNTDTLRRVLSEFGLPEMPDEFELDDADLTYFDGEQYRHWIDSTHDQQRHVSVDHREAIGIARALSHKRNEELRRAPAVSDSAPVALSTPPPSLDLTALLEVLTALNANQMAGNELLTQIATNTAKRTKKPTGSVTLGVLVVVVLLLFTAVALLSR